MNTLSLLRLRKSPLWVGILGLYILVGVMCSVPGGSAIAIGVSFLLLLIAFSRLEFVGLIVVFLVAESLVHLLKRAIFLFGPQPQWAYYGIQLVPTMVFGLVLIATFQRLRWREIPLSGKILIAYLGLALMTTLISPAGLPFIVRLSAIHQQLMPFFMFFVGMMLTLERFPRLGKVMALLAVISVVYGIIQFVGGPTPIDRTWATYTYAYSIQGQKVFAYMTDWTVFGVVPEFRIYSFYADPLTWGLFLVAGLGGGIVARRMGELTTVCWRWIIIMVLIGLFLTLTRTPWIGLLGAVLGYILMGWRAFRRPWLLFGLTLGTFLVVIWGGNYIFGCFSGKLPLYQNPILARYATLGTLSARIGAWDLFKSAVSTNWLIGNGYGFSSYYVRLYASSELGKVVHSHDFLVELLLYTGLPGLIFFLTFYFQWIREGFSAWRMAKEDQLRNAIRWILALSFGFVLTGYFNGSNFMNYQFFLILGILCGKRSEE